MREVVQHPFSPIVGPDSRVLILADETGSGNGERLTYAEAGWEE